MSCWHTFYFHSSSALFFNALKRQMRLKYTVWIGCWALWRFCRCVSVDMMWWWLKEIWVEPELHSWHVSFLFPPLIKLSLSAGMTAGSNLLQKGYRNEGGCMKWDKTFKIPKCSKLWSNPWWRKVCRHHFFFLQQRTCCRWVQTWCYMKTSKGKKLNMRSWTFPF